MRKNVKAAVLNLGVETLIEGRQILDKVSPHFENENISVNSFQLWCITFEFLTFL